MAKRNNYGNDISNEVDNVTEDVSEISNLKEETVIKTEKIPIKKYTVLKGYEISHKGKKYLAGDKIELSDEEKSKIKYGLK